MLQAQLAQRKAEAEPEAEPTREEGEGAPGATRVPSASPNERLRRVSCAWKTDEGVTQTFLSTQSTDSPSYF